jgi:hypothetical protein
MNPGIWFAIAFAILSVAAVLVALMAAVHVTANDRRRHQYPATFWGDEE